MTDRGRVAHITTAHPVHDNRILHKECRALVRAGLEVHLVAPADRDEILGDVAITAIPRRRRRLSRMVLGPMDAWRAVRRVRPDLIHVHDPELIPLAIAWKLVNRRPAVYDAHEDLTKQVAGKSYLPDWARSSIALLATLLETCADRLLSGVVSATPAIARKYRRAHVAVVQNFPWSTGFPTRTQLDQHQQDAIYIGAITNERGLRRMLALAESGRGQGSLVLAGPIGSCQAQDIEAAPGVRYDGILATREIPRLLAEARVGLALLSPLPNYLESQATKIYEYMAAGRPFIASDFPAWVTQLGPFGCGIFVNPDDDAAVARALALLRADLEMAREMGDRGRAAWEKHFTFEPEAEQLITFTRELIR